jgi:glutamyl/glutaminyl-tRNA synthetase
MGRGPRWHPGPGNEPKFLSNDSSYRGRIAPSPTGYLHLGHARTFWIASRRARDAGGALVLRNDDLDAARHRMDFGKAMYEDLEWLGLSWDEGPDVGGPHAPYNQSERLPLYRAALERLHSAGLIYPCERSRRDVIEAAGAPHEGGEDDEPVYPASFRPDPELPLPPLGNWIGVNWRLRVPDGEVLGFDDTRLGPQRAVAGRDFGDFPVWRKDDSPSYQLACTVDDAEMAITEVVRGQDLIRSTFRQLLLYRALGQAVPAFHHCPLMVDEKGVRLAKRHDALSLRALRARGADPRSLREGWDLKKP